MFEVKIDASELDRHLGGIIRRLEDPTSLMASISEELVSESEQQFKDESAPNAKWTDLAESTKKRRTQIGKWPGKKLQVVGALARSVQAYHSKTEAGVIAGSGESANYAAIHLFGGQAGRGKKATIPARRYLPIKGDPNNAELSNSAAGAILKLSQGYFSGGKKT